MSDSKPNGTAEPEPKKKTLKFIVTVEYDPVEKKHIYSVQTNTGIPIGIVANCLMKVHTRLIHQELEAEAAQAAAAAAQQQAQQIELANQIPPLPPMKKRG